MLTDAANKHFESAFTELLVKGLRHQAPNILGQPGELLSSDTAFLLSVASRLALSTSHSDRHLAYETIALLLELTTTPSPGMMEAMRAILARLGNFPALTLTERKFSRSQSVVSGSATLAFESIARESENTVELRDREVTLTDFQRRLYDALSRWNSLSVSAPTSAGKSFLLSLDIVRHHVRSMAGAIVFVVPTRALIRQVMRDAVERLNEFRVPNVNVLCVPESAAQAEGEGLVYVLTQERLVTLLNSPDDSLHISLLIVDEAQEVSKSGRGIILQSAIEQTLRQHPEARVLFASPLRSNPGFLLSLFGRTEEGEFFVERTSPVSQNIVVISSVKRRPQFAQFRLLRDKSYVDVGTVELPFPFRQNRGPLLALFASHLTQPGDSTIIYVNEPSEAESVASELAARIPSAESSLTPEVLDLIKFLEESLHPAYPLSRFLKHGVAFHYGMMPEIVRVAVEDLFKAGAIRFICCTSTLLQGVNMPAKNVVMYRPTRGRGHPLDAGDFWNLAGRAGRLMREYRGNVWCISPEEWDENPLEGERLSELTSAYQGVLQTQASDVAGSATAIGRAAENGDTLLADQAYSKLFSEFTLEGKLVAESRYSTPDTRAIHQAIDATAAQFAQSATASPEMFRRHSGVLPQRLEELAGRFQSATAPESLIPIHPRALNGLQRLRDIFGWLDDVFFKTGNRSYMYFATLAYWWMIATPIGVMIRNKLEYKKIPDDERRVTAAIRELLENVDRDLRFRYVKYLRLYGDLLREHFEKIQREDLVARISPLHLFIEYGACDENLIHLMGLGLSRTSAISFALSAGIANDATWQECRDAVESRDLAALDLPIVVIREIQSVRHRFS